MAHDDVTDVLAAAAARAEALASRDDGALRALLHPRFVWTSHAGERFDGETYVASNHHGDNVWLGQRLVDPCVVVVDETAVLTCTAEDRVDTGSGHPETYVMAMTQTWVRCEDGRWRCLAGHAGPRLDHPEEA